ncbi:Hypothetical predicted protein [Pelobates cultripes]|uniref:Endonuclease/exonuclease/phosphatase domain-containing protein n=1 Tax=Pelobates cultripes TaxID=61616 RepID=A0AAD1VTK1_PELCU|nr:Hypothetical predicted protein [Pelobates cultripes]
MTDPGGRFIFLKGTIAHHTYTFASIYSPNRGQHKFFTKTLAKLEKFRAGLLILAGDLNVPLDPRVDTTRGTSTVPEHGLHAMRRALTGMGLVDCWRVAHPDDRDFSYYSSVYRQYSRIDYIFMPQESLALLRDASIGIINQSDHAPNTVYGDPEADRPRLEHAPTDALPRSSRTTHRTRTGHTDTAEKGVNLLDITAREEATGTRLTSKYQ